MRWPRRRLLGLVGKAESLLDCLRDEAAARLDGGARLADVQRELIDTAQGLSEDERAALWLFAWAYRPSPLGQAGHSLEWVR
jgi:hypothetical protein